MEEVRNILKQSVAVKELIVQDPILLERISTAAQKILECFKHDGKLLLCGNGGSAADAQHLAAEFTGRFYIDRPPLFAEALHVNTSYLTAVANDYSFDEVYARMVQAKGRKGDVLLAFSTSGNSKNIIKALEKAKELNMLTIGFTGETGGKMKDLCTILLNVPSSDTPRIQECHITIGHIICELVERKFFPH